MFALIRKAAVVAACVLAVALVYWGAGSSRMTVEGTPCLDAATAEAARAGTPTPDPLHPWMPVSRDSEERCRLRRALLTTADLGNAWNQSVRDDYASATAADCGTPMPVVIAGLTQMFFTDDAANGETSLYLSVYAFRPGGASDLIAALRRDCSSIGDAREERLLLYELLELPALGDEAIGLRVSSGLSNDDTMRPFGIAYIRRGDLVAIVSAGSDDDPAPILSRIGQIIADRLERVGPMPEPTYAASEGCDAPPPAQGAVAEALRAGLLTLDEMPMGWVEDPPGRCALIIKKSDCEGSRGGPPDPIGWVGTGFRELPRSSIVSNVGLYRTRDAEEIMRVQRQTNEGPAECSIVDGGDRYTAHWDPVEAPALGDDAVAWHYTTRGLLPADADWYVILIRRGQTIASVAFRPEPYLSDDSAVVHLEFAQMAKSADERLASIQNQLSGD